MTKPCCLCDSDHVRIDDYMRTGVTFGSAAVIEWTAHNSCLNRVLEALKPGLAKKVGELMGIRKFYRVQD